MSAEPVTAPEAPAKQSLRASLRAFWAWAKTPIFIALTTRAALFVFGYLGLLWVGPSKPRIIPGRPFLEPWFRWDSGWYMQIITRGYSLYEPEPGQRNVAFFPLYPMTVKAVSWVLNDPWLSSYLVSNVLFVVAMVVLYRFVLEKWNASVAEKCIALIACGPHAFYFSACYTESLFLACWACAFYAAHRQKWLASGLFVALSGATRGIGGIALVGVGLMALEQVGWKVRKLSWKVLFLSTGVLGLAGYMAYLKLQFGDPLIFAGVTEVRGWGAGRDFTQMMHYVGRMFDFAAWSNGTQPVAEEIHIVLLFAATVLSVLGWKRVGPALTLFSLATLFVYWRVWYSASRYVAVLFPVFLVIAIMLDQKPRRFLALLFSSTMLMALFTWLFTHHEWVS